MEQAIYSILELIKTNITDPLYAAISSIEFFNQFIIFINKLLNGVFNIASDRELTNIEYITLELIAELIGILFFIWFIVLLVGLFNFVFKTIKNLLSNTISFNDNKTWRKQWRRKK